MSMRLIDADELILDLDDSLFYIDAIPFVEDSPTIDAEPVRHGKWITKDVGFLQKSFICSACGGWEHNLACEHEGMNFCPQCGARMA